VFALESHYTVPLGEQNIGQVLFLRRSDGVQLCVLNTHILFNTARGERKLAQMARLFGAASAHLVAHPGARVVLCLDANCTPASLAIAYLRGTGGPVSLAGRNRRTLSGQDPMPRQPADPVRAPLLSAEHDGPETLALERFLANGTHTLHNPFCFTPAVSTPPSSFSTAVECVAKRLLRFSSSEPTFYKLPTNDGGLHHGRRRAGAGWRAAAAAAAARCARGAPVVRSPVGPSPACRDAGAVVVEVGSTTAESIILN